MTCLRIATITGCLLIANPACGDDEVPNPSKPVWRAANRLVWTRTTVNGWASDSVRREVAWTRSLTATAHVPAASLDWKAALSKTNEPGATILQMPQIKSEEALEVFPREVIPDVSPPILSPEQAQRYPRTLFPSPR